MLKIDPPNYKFCPMCGTKLATRPEEGSESKYCRKCGWVYYPHVFGAACAVAVRRGQILLVKRARIPNKGTWMLPAGFVSFGEHPSETVLREVKEETGFRAKVIKLLDVLQVDDDPRALGHFAFFYEVKVTGEMVSGDMEENTQVAWQPLAKLPKIGWHTHQEIIRRVMHGNARDVL